MNFTKLNLKTKTFFRRATRPIPPNHPLYPHIAHALHQLACGVGGHRTRRHNALVRIIAAACRNELGAFTETKHRLCSSATSGKKVDIVITSHDLHPPVLAVDCTVSCPLLPSHLNAAVKDAALLFTTRAAEKMSKHLPGCVDLGRAFLAIVHTTFGGIGPQPAREWLDSLFSVSYTNEYLSGGTGQQTANRRLLFLRQLHAVSIRTTTELIVRLLSAPHQPPSPRNQPPT